MLALACTYLPLSAGSLRAQETILQYFNTSWPEIEARLPEIAEAGYLALWLPVPSKGASGTYSVGYDPYDRFDLGDREGSGSVRTRYGTKVELLSLVEAAHRFGLRVYFDNVSAHTGGPLDAATPAGTLFPGMRGFVPEDFHLVRRHGGWAKASDSVDYNDEWQVLNRNPFAWDLAHELPVNTSFNPTGTAENNDYPRWSGIRQPGETQYYLDTDLPVATDALGTPVHTFSNKEPWQDTGYGNPPVGAGNGKFDWADTNTNGQHDPGEPSESYTDTGIDPSRADRRIAAWGFGNNRYDMGNPVAEDVNTFLFRASRYQIDQLHADGFRLDAVKHVPSSFFGKQSGADRDRVDWGYTGQIQVQYNITHGYTDWGNHRDTNFNAALGRDDALLFGEHLGAPPAPGGYLDAGMRLASDDFLNQVGGFSGIGSSLAGYDNPGQHTFGVNEGVMYCLSHDNNSMSGSERPAAHAYMLMKAGLPIVYTDGYNVAGGPDYFPKPSYTPFLGQYGQNWVTGALRVRRDFIRGNQTGRWSTQNFAAWEFRDKSENPAMSDAAATTLLVMMARNYIAGQQAPAGFTTTFPANALLKNYSPHNGSFFAFAGNDGRIYNPEGQNVTVPSGGYFAFAPPVPEALPLWSGTDVRAIQILENNVPTGFISQPRRDGVNGDPAYAYAASIPLVRDGSNLTIRTRTDGLTSNVRIKLDGGVDLNSAMGFGSTTGVKLDNLPGTSPTATGSTDLLGGYEQARFTKRTAEKFAATDTARNIIGSPGAETWEAVIGQSTAIVRNNAAAAPNTANGTATWAYHDPLAGHGLGSTLQFSPTPAAAAGSPVQLVVKIGYVSSGVERAWIYYTTDGTSYPEGSDGLPRSTTQVAALSKISNGTADGGGTPQWWRGTLPAQASGTKLRYKIGVLKNTATERYPANIATVQEAQRMETVFEAAGFNASTVSYCPHADQGNQATGLKEGLHILRARAYLPRGSDASLFNTFSQTFYLDQQRPTGSIRFPSQDNDTIGGSTYGVLLLTDASVTGVTYQILDSNTANDSAANGNGTGNWATASAVSVPTATAGSGFVKEWRFDCKNIPTSGNATIRVRLRELSSSSDQALTDAAGWFTTLTRVVNTGYPVNYQIAFPATDGSVTGSGYAAKAVFDKSIGFNVPDATLLGEFSVYTASTLSGQADGETLLPRSRYSLVRNETASQDALAFILPNFYNGDPEFLHSLRVVFRRADTTLTDIRLVKAFPDARSDADNDGLPDYWENAYRLESNNPFGIHGASGDADSDGFSNLDEYAFGTSPVNGSSQDQPSLSVTPGLTEGTCRLTWPASAARRYQVQTSTTANGWTDYGPLLTPAADDPAFTWTTPATTSIRRFYRVLGRLP